MESSKKVIYAAFIGNCLIALTKFIAALVTGSSAMLSEGIHSAVDTGNQILMMHGMSRSKVPADEQFPFGHGKEIYFWSFVVSILIFAVGAGLSLYEGAHHILHPVRIRDAHVSYIVLGLAMLFEGTSWYVAFSEFSKKKGQGDYFSAVHRSKDPSIFIVLFEDSAALLGLAAAFIGISLSESTGNPLFDGAASLVIGLILGGTAAWLAYETKGLLIGESAARDVVQGIREIVSSYREVRHVNEVLTMHMGPDSILANISIDFIDPISSAEVEATVARLDKEIKQAYPSIKRIFIEAEAWRAKDQ